MVSTLKILFLWEESPLNDFYAKILILHCPPSSSKRLMDLINYRQRFLCNRKEIEFFDIKINLFGNSFSSKIKYFA